jgi:serralysin
LRAAGALADAVHAATGVRLPYNDGWSGQPSKSADWGYQIGPGAFDIAAMQKLYGVDTTYHVGADSYTLPGTNTSGTGWFTLWDAGGDDTIKAPSGAGSVTIDLRAATLTEGDPGAGGNVSWVGGISGGFTIANGVVIENALGGAGNDKLIGNAAANTLTGGGGEDILTGGLGPDTFMFITLTDSAAGAKRATITDFIPGEDTIDLLAIDANSLLSGNQNFQWISDAGFTGTPGDLRFSNGILAGDVNGDRKADFEIALSSVVKMTWQDDLIA